MNKYVLSAFTNACIVSESGELEALAQDSIDAMLAPRTNAMIQDVECTVQNGHAGWADESKEAAALVVHLAMNEDHEKEDITVVCTLYVGFVPLIVDEQSH
jgi:hypothetical protein